MGKQNLTEEQREVIRKRNRERKWTHASREKLRLANLGKEATEETKLKMSLKRKGVLKS